MDQDDILTIVEIDHYYVEAFCHKYGTKIVDILPNTEDFPPRGLMYVFDNQLGGFSIEGIKNSLEDDDSLENKVSK